MRKQMIGLLSAAALAGCVGSREEKGVFVPAEKTGAAIQKAIDSGAPKLIFDRQSGPWIARPLVGRSNLELVFEEGVELVDRAQRVHPVAPSRQGARQRQTFRRQQRTDGRRDLRVGILDGLGLVQNKRTPLHLGNHVVVPNEQRIGGDHDICLGGGAEESARDVTALAVMDIDAERRRETRRLALPVGEQSQRRDDKDGSVRGMGYAVGEDPGNCLDGFAEAHVVRQQRAEPVVRQEPEPLDAPPLVIPEFSLESLNLSLFPIPYSLFPVPS